MASTATKSTTASKNGTANGAADTNDILAGFEMFTGGYMRGANDGPAVTVADIELTLNDPAYQALGRPEKVVLLYNREREVIAIQPGNDRPGAYQVRHPASAKKRAGGSQAPVASNHFVTSRAFMAHYDIKIAAPRVRFSAETHGNVILVDLRATPLQVFSGTRAAPADAAPAPAGLPAGFRVSPEGSTETPPTEGEGGQTES